MSDNYPADQWWTALFFFCTKANLQSTKYSEGSKHSDNNKSYVFFQQNSTLRFSTTKLLVLAK
jgi:hypothetical protein